MQIRYAASTVVFLLALLACGDSELENAQAELEAYRAALTEANQRLGQAWTDLEYAQRLADYSCSQLKNHLRDVELPEEVETP